MGRVLFYLYFNSDVKKNFDKYDKNLIMLSGIPKKEASYRGWKKRKFNAEISYQRFDIFRV